MKKAFYLSNCSTCKKIIKSFDLPQEITFYDIKTNHLTNEQLEEMKSLAGSYEALFNRRARKYSALGLKNKVLNENDFKNLILEDYTFLKRPVFILNEQIFIGNAKDTVARLKEKINE